jgi:hypothetical protein
VDCCLRVIQRSIHLSRNHVGFNTPGGPYPSGEGIQVRGAGAADEPSDLHGISGKSLLDDSDIVLEVMLT